jgi:5'(3')-deoxyribonucleotidase
MIRSLVLDVDNVLADSIRAWCTLAKRRLRIDVAFDSITNHKLVGCVNASPEEVFRLQDYVWVNWRRLKPIEAGIERTIDSIRKMGVEIVIATSGPKRHIPYVRDWLALRRIGYDTFCSVTHKSSIKADALVDDAPEEILLFTSEGKAAFLYEQPWNRSMRETSFTRIPDIGTLLDILQKDRLAESEHDCIVRSGDPVHAKMSQS